jgi:hypothetical protein
VRRSEQDRSDKEEFERENEVDRDNVCSPKRQKKLRAEPPGEKLPERTRSRTTALLSKTV